MTTPKHRTAAVEAVDALLADWDDGEATDVPRTPRLWRVPGSAKANELARALAAWEPPPVQVRWQDIGGGTSQILEYVRASLDNEDRPGQIDLLFGGGTDIYLRLVSKGKYLEAIDIPPALLGESRPS